MFDFRKGKELKPGAENEFSKRYKANDILTRKVMPLPVASSSKVRMEASSVSELSSYESMGCLLLH